MRFERLALRNIGPYHGEVEIDFTAIEGVLVAVCGPNGSGKSTLLELLAGTLFRTCPTRGTLASLATARDAYAEVTIVNGARYTVRQDVDAISGKGETSIVDAQGVPVLDSSKRSDGDRWVSEHFPHPSVLYSGPFSVQGQRGFLDLSAADRKKLLVRMLGLERLERMAEAAREYARTEKTALEVQRGVLLELESPDLEALSANLHIATAAVAESIERVRIARVALDRAKLAAQDSTRKQELAEQRRAVEARRTLHKTQIAECELKIQNNRSLPARRVEIETAVGRGRELDALLSSWGDEVAAARGAADIAGAEQLSSERAEQRAVAAVTGVRARMARIEARLRDKQRVLEAVQTLATLSQHEQEHLSKVRDCETRTVALEAVLLNGKDKRITGMRTGLSAVAQTPDTGARVARFTLEKDDEHALLQGKAPAELQAARAELTQLRRALEVLREQATTAGRLAARAPDIEAATLELQAALTELATAEAAVVAAVTDKEAAIEKALTAVQRVTAALASQQKCQADRNELTPLINLAPRLALCEARIEELSAQLAPLQAAVSQCELELTALPELEVETVDLLVYERDVETREAHEHAARAAQSRAQQAIEAADLVCLRRYGIEQTIEEGVSVLADWTRLALDLGRDGLQAMELDAALPELNAMANDLLRTCHGSRFTVELRTDRLSADGAKVLEGLDVRVIDTEHGRDALAETYSGGECVIVGEALALALTMLSCRRSGIERPTLVRDESGAALDPDNGRAYVAMLRHAAKAIGADKVLFVTHTPELQELADARVSISEDGTVTT